MGKKVYKDLDKLPSGRASGNISEGCLVLEGGGCAEKIPYSWAEL